MLSWMIDVFRKRLNSPVYMEGFRSGATVGFIVVPIITVAALYMGTKQYLKREEGKLTNARFF